MVLIVVKSRYFMSKQNKEHIGLNRRVSTQPACLRGAHIGPHLHMGLTLSPYASQQMPMEMLASSGGCMYSCTCTYVESFHCKGFQQIASCSKCMEQPVSIVWRGNRWKLNSCSSKAKINYESGERMIDVDQLI